jgi:sugar phosphate isomerase/epimerase
VRLVSLAHLTVLDLAPPEMIRLAARTGYGAVGLRLIAVTETTAGYPLMDDPAALRATKAALAATGLRVLDIEFVRITPEIDLDALEPFLAAGAELGARYVIAAPYDPDLARLADRLAVLSDRAEPYGLRPVLEFFPWTDVPDLAAATQVVEAAGRPGLGILVDTLHFDRSGSRLDELAALDRSLLPFLHLCDAPVHPPYTTDDLLHAGRAERLPPGKGGIDIASILRAMPPDAPVALEVPMRATMSRHGAEAVATLARQGAERILGRDRT